MISIAIGRIIYLITAWQCISCGWSHFNLYYFMPNLFIYVHVAKVDSIRLWECAIQSSQANGVPFREEVSILIGLCVYSRCSARLWLDDGFSTLSAAHFRHLDLYLFYTSKRRAQNSGERKDKQQVMCKKWKYRKELVEITTTTINWTLFKSNRSLF